MRTAFELALISLVVGLGTIALATDTAAQEPIAACATVTSGCTGVPGMKTCTVERYVLVGTSGCGLLESNNAICSRTTLPMGYVRFVAVQTGPAPLCHWHCLNCSSVTIDTKRGLPVELLEFDIEDGPIGEESDAPSHEASPDS